MKFTPFVALATALLPLVTEASSLPEADQRIRNHLEAGHSVLLVIGDLTETETDNLYRVFPEKLRAEIEANPAEKRNLTFRRYGMPVDAETRMPYGFTKTGPGKWRANCLICHGGNVASPDGKPFFRVGMPNREIELVNYFEDRFAMAKRFPKFVDADLIRAPFYKSFRDGLKTQPLSENRGTINVWGSFGLESGLRNLDLNLDPARVAKLLVGKPFNFGMDPCDMDPPSWWGTSYRKYFYPDAFAPNTPRIMLQILNWPGNAVKKWVPWMSDIVDEIAKLEPAKFTLVVNTGKVKRGEIVFNDTCARCHGTYAPDGGVNYPNRITPIATIGTDDLRLKSGVTKVYREYLKNSWLGEYGKSELPVRTEPTGYQAPVLRGVWATAPYFHNGSVPTIYHVLHPAERPNVWQADLTQYDFEKLGLKFNTTTQRSSLATAEARRTVYDVSLPGKKNGGHTFAEELSETEKDEVLEYLKTL